MFSRVSEKRRESSRIRMIRNEGRLHFNDDGSPKVERSPELTMSDQEFKELVDHCVGGSIPETNVCLYLVRRARENVRRDYRNISFESYSKHVRDHQELWKQYYIACVEAFADEPGCEPPMLPAELKTLIENQLAVQGHAHRWDLSNGILKYVHTKSLVSAKRKYDAEEKIDMSSASAEPASASSSSAFLYTALVDTNRHIIKIQRVSTLAHASSDTHQAAVTRYASLSKNPQQFRAELGLTLQEFDSLYQQIAVVPKWKDYSHYARDLQDDKDKLLATLYLIRGDKQNDIANKMATNEGTIFFLKQHMKPIALSCLTLLRTQRNENIAAAADLNVSHLSLAHKRE
jgi:hypothetical protein